MSEMTDARYVYEAGRKCPYNDCRSTNLENCGAPEKESGDIFQQVECYDCGRMWDEVYQLIGWKELGDGAA